MLGRLLGVLTLATATTGDGFVIAHADGTRADWLKNVPANDPATIVHPS